MGQLETNDVSVTTFVAVGAASALNKATNSTRGLYGADVLVTELLLERLLDHETSQAGLNLTHSQDKDYVAVSDRFSFTGFYRLNINAI